MHAGVSPFHRRMRHAALALACALAMSPSLAGPTIKTGGTGSALHVISALGDAFRQTRPETDIIVLTGLGSSGAIKALGADVIDLALSARPLKPAERSPRFLEKEVARTPLVFAGIRVYPGLTLEKVAAIYAGERQVWPDGSVLRLVLRPDHDTEAALLRAASPAVNGAVGKALARSGMHIALTDQDATNALATVPGAFGLTTLAMLVGGPQAIRAFPLDGITPDLDSLNEGSYRMFKPLYLVVRANAAEPVHAWMAFIESPRGAAILTAHGYQALAPTKW
jgi:phosphate transport system substrate-binding protein